MKFVALVSSGIDSPVATYLISKKAKEIILVHADNRPFTDDREIKNFITLAKHLKKHLSSSLKAYIVPHGNTLNAYTQNCNSRFTCVICKRMMVRYAEKIAEKEQADAIIMGDSLGQVASQTIQNIRVVEQAVKIPILRPLIGLDKEDVVKIAKEIGTYDLSILPSGGCSAVPIKPSTRARLDQILKEEKRIAVDNLVSKAVHDSESVNF
jgi:thiamine biosynthesis protein ThiI